VIEHWSNENELAGIKVSIYYRARDGQITVANCGHTTRDTE